MQLVDRAPPLALHRPWPFMELVTAAWRNESAALGTRRAPPLTCPRQRPSSARACAPTGLAPRLWLAPHSKESNRATGRPATCLGCSSSLELAASRSAQIRLTPPALALVRSASPRRPRPCSGAAFRAEALPQPAALDLRGEAPEGREAQEGTADASRRRHGAPTHRLEYSLPKTPWRAH